MNCIHTQLLACLSAFAQGQSAAPIAENFSDWQGLLDAAGQHKLEAVVYGALGRDPGFCGQDKALLSQWRQRAYAQSMAQEARTARLVALTGALEAAGIPYAVVKGAICRSLYPRGELRISADEDIYIQPHHLAACSRILEQEGYVLRGQEEKDVTHWYDGRVGLHIELHVRLTESEDTERLFAGFTPVRRLTQAGALLTLPPTLHLAYLLYHARKHLILGGVGIRTVCDIAKFYAVEKENICRPELDTLLETLGCVSLFQHALAIGRDSLGIPCPECALPQQAGALLWDLMDAGIYGQSSMTRRHSGTLLAGQAAGNPGLWSVLFPKKEAMASKYPVLQKHPGLLPVMWLRRLGRYGWEALTNKNSSPTGSLQLGKQRLEMLVNYEIIAKDPGKKP